MRDAARLRLTAGVERAVVTGGAGFIGSHLVDTLVTAGIEVMIVDNFTSSAVPHANRSARLEELDVSRGDLASVFGSWHPQLVFHLAAQVNVPRAEVDPERDLMTNAVGTLRVCRAARAAGANRIVYVSSGGAVYGDVRRAALESDRPLPRSHYGLHKWAGESYVRLNASSFAIARPANVYGPRQVAGSDGAVVPSFVDAVLSGRPLVIHGNGSQVRDMIHVSDVVRGLVLLAQLPQSGVWNISSGMGVSVLQLANIIEGAAHRAPHRFYEPQRAADVAFSVLSNARLRRYGWEPTISLDAGIRDLLGQGPESPRRS